MVVVVIPPTIRSRDSPEFTSPMPSHAPKFHFLRKRTSVCTSIEPSISSISSTFLPSLTEGPYLTVRDANTVGLQGGSVSTVRRSVTTRESPGNGPRVAETPETGLRQPSQPSRQPCFGRFGGSLPLSSSSMTLRAICWRRSTRSRPEAETDVTTGR